MWINAQGVKEINCYCVLQKCGVLTIVQQIFNHFNISFFDGSFQQWHIIFCPWHKSIHILWHWEKIKMNRLQLIWFKNNIHHIGAAKPEGWMISKKYVIPIMLSDIAIAIWLAISEGIIGFTSLFEFFMKNTWRWVWRDYCGDIWCAEQDISAARLTMYSDTQSTVVWQDWRGLCFYPSVFFYWRLTIIRSKQKLPRSWTNELTLRISTLALIEWCALKEPPNVCINSTYVVG